MIVLRAGPRSFINPRWNVSYRGPLSELDGDLWSEKRCTERPTACRPNETRLWISNWPAPVDISIYLYLLTSNMCNVLSPSTARHRLGLYTHASVFEVTCELISSSIKFCPRRNTPRVASSAPAISREQARVRVKTVRDTSISCSITRYFQRLQPKTMLSGRKSEIYGKKDRLRKKGDLDKEEGPREKGKLREKGLTKKTYLEKMWERGKEGQPRGKDGSREKERPRKKI